MKIFKELRMQKDAEGDGEVEGTENSENVPKV